MRKRDPREMRHTLEVKREEVEKAAAAARKRDEDEEVRREARIAWRREQLSEESSILIQV